MKKKLRQLALISSVIFLSIFLFISTVGIPEPLKYFLFPIVNLYLPQNRLTKRIQNYELVKTILHKNNISEKLSEDEIDWIVQILSPFNRLMLSQLQVSFAPMQISAQVWGLGYCDQVNRIGAIALAQFFDRVEMIGINSPPPVGGHSFGRVLAPKMHDWIYFDLWPEDLFLLKLDKNKKVKIIRRVDRLGMEKSHSIAGNDIFLRIYRDLDHAEPLLSFPRTALGYLAQALTRRFKVQEFAQGGYSEKHDTEDGRKHPLLLPQRNLDLYLQARQEHIFGNINKAMQLYQEFLNEAPKDTPFAQAAQIFLEDFHKLQKNNRMKFQT